MAQQNRNWLAASSWTSTLHFCMSEILFFSMVQLSAISSDAGAAPITLQFEAVVGAPRAGTFPIELPFSFSEGQRISGSFTFEPFDAPSSTLQLNTTQNFPFRLQIESDQLTTSTYQLQVDNNLTSDEAPIPEDRILLQCLGIGTPCTPVPIQDAPNIEWSFSWTITGGGNVLDGADIPAGLESWNQMSPSTILVSFQDRTTGRGTGFEATITTLAHAPEPTVASLVVSFALSAAAFPAVRRR